MASDTELPNIRVGRDAAREDAERDGEVEYEHTVEYLNYEVLTERGWGLEDEDLFEKAADADLDEKDHGAFGVRKNRYVLDAAEDQDHEWPFECRAASCANCSAILYEGSVSMDMDLILTDEEVDERGILLTCQAVPTTDEVRIVYNAMHLEYLQDRVIGVREV